MSFNNTPFDMEDYFQPGFKTKPAVHVGSQTLHFFHNKPNEQAWEGFNLAAASDKDVAIVRNIDDEYIKYWSSLMEMSGIFNLQGTDKGEYLTQVLLDSPKLIQDIQNKMAKDAKLMVFLPTQLEQTLANRLGIPLHGSPGIGDTYGTKSGIRILAEEASVVMPPGFICKTYKEVKDALDHLREKFDYIVIKHDLSIGGYLSKKLYVKTINDLREELNNVVDGQYMNDKYILVIEGWINTKASLCAHIELLQDKDPIICGAWQQVIAPDGVSNKGAVPLQLSKKVMKSFLDIISKIANKLKEKKAIGSYAPDFIITANGEKNVKPDTVLLVELNARVPRTAFPLEIVKQVRGKVGNGFYAKDIIVDRSISVKEIFEALKDAKLLITERNSLAKGIVPYNTGMLEWKTFAVVAMADSWNETKQIIERAENIFKRF